MRAPAELEAKLHRLLRRANRDRNVATAAPRVDAVGALFRKQTREWFHDVVMPRLRALQRTFGTGEAITLHETLPHASLTLPAGTTQPVAATLEVRATLHRGRARFTVDVSICPVLTDYDRTASYEIDLDEPDLEGLGRFLDYRFLHFAADALRTGSPDSPYQAETRVTDPVCGATFPRHEAAGLLNRAGRVHYFCSKPCWEAFAARPGGFPS